MNAATMRASVPVSLIPQDILTNITTPLRTHPVSMIPYMKRKKPNPDSGLLSSITVVTEGPPPAREAADVAAGGVVEDLISVPALIP